MKGKLPTFATTLDHIEIVELWRSGKYPNLSNIVPTPSQAWQIVELVFTSPRFTYNEKTDILENQKNLTPGFEA